MNRRKLIQSILGIGAAVVAAPVALAGAFKKKRGLCRWPFKDTPCMYRPNALFQTDDGEYRARVYVDELPKALRHEKHWNMFYALRGWNGTTSIAEDDELTTLGSKWKELCSFMDWEEVYGEGGGTTYMLAGSDRPETVSIGVNDVPKVPSGNWIAFHVEWKDPTAGGFYIPSDVAADLMEEIKANPRRTAMTNYDDLGWL